MDEHDDGPRLAPVAAINETGAEMELVLTEAMADVKAGTIRGLVLVTEDSDGTTTNRYAPCDRLKLLAGLERAKHRINRDLDAANGNGD